MTQSKDEPKESEANAQPEGLANAQTSCLAEKVIIATVQELGRSLLQKNQARKSLRMYKRLLTLKKDNTGYEKGNSGLGMHKRD